MTNRNRRVLHKYVRGVRLIAYHACMNELRLHVLQLRSLIGGNSNSKDDLKETIWTASFGFDDIDKHLSH